MPPPKQPSGRTIYVVDDDLAMREVVAATLTLEGYDVQQAADGQQLLDALLDRARSGSLPQLVVSDVAMPRMTGPAACQAARAAGIATPFIFMTAFASSSGRRAAEAVGAVAVFDKPFAMDELVATVREQVSAGVRSLGAATASNMASTARHFDDRYEETIPLADGSVVVLRMVRPTDKALLLDGFERMSPDSRYRRFFSYKHRLTESDLRYLTDIDGETHVAIGALRRLPDGRDQGVGVARFVRMAEDPEVAEPALAVVDDMQGKGLGTALLVRLNAAAQELGVTRFRCHVLANNARMLGIIGKLDAAAVQQREDDLVLVDFEVPQRPWDPAARQRPRGRALHRALALAAEGALRIHRAFSWLDAPKPEKDSDTGAGRRHHN